MSNDVGSRHETGGRADKFELIVYRFSQLNMEWNGGGEGGGHERPGIQNKANK